MEMKDGGERTREKRTGKKIGERRESGGKY